MSCIESATLFFGHPFHRPTAREPVFRCVSHTSNRERNRQSQLCLIERECVKERHTDPPSVVSGTVSSSGFQVWIRG